MMIDNTMKYIKTTCIFLEPLFLYLQISFIITEDPIVLLEHVGAHDGVVAVHGEGEGDQGEAGQQQAHTPAKLSPVLSSLQPRHCSGCILQYMRG